MQAEGTEVLSTLASLDPSTHQGFFPDDALIEAPYPYPGATSYPGDTYSTGLVIATLAEGTETLTALTES